MADRFTLWRSTGVAPGPDEVSRGHYKVTPETDPNPDPLAWVEAAKGLQGDIETAVCLRRPFGGGETEAVRRAWVARQCAALLAPAAAAPTPVTPVVTPSSPPKQKLGLGAVGSTPPIFYKIPTKKIKVVEVAKEPFTTTSAGMLRLYALIPALVLALWGLVVMVVGGGTNPAGELRGMWALAYILVGTLLIGGGGVFAFFSLMGWWPLGRKEGRPFVRFVPRPTAATDNED
ncbi:TPA: hypothetical protein DEB00_02850 [Candidatus Uhrbacteria bacterium]|nr:hypothetical protein [Candidatus Uhrbacteria bacterium]